MLVIKVVMVTITSEISATFFIIVVSHCSQSVQLSTPVCSCNSKQRVWLSVLSYKSTAVVLL